MNGAMTGLRDYSVDARVLSVSALAAVLGGVSSDFDRVGWTVWGRGSGDL